MPIYYKSNALYDYIIDNNLNSFEFVSGNLWQLVYADANCIPRLLVLVSGVEGAHIYKPISNNECKAYNRIQELSSLSGVPNLFVRFKIDQDINGFHILLQNNSFAQIEVAKLTQIFSNYGLPISENVTKKYLNDKTSSAYHNWQRGSLGSALKVTDIDLMKINPLTGSIGVIYELKRSYICINTWNPYPDDYNNFRILRNLLLNTGITFKIAYNVRTTKPTWNDNISVIKLFNVTADDNNLIRYDRTVQLNDFIMKG